EGATGPARGTATLAVTQREVVSTTIDRRKGAGELEARSPGPGNVKLFGEGLKGSSIHPDAAGPLALPITAKGSAKRKLKRTGRAKADPTVTYVPVPGGQIGEAD